MNNRIPLLAIGLAAALTSGAASPLWMRDARLSPDGSKIAFSYKGDIYTVSSAGGTATRLTTNPAYENAPVWSPDGSLIAFASSRDGGRNVYIMPSAGGSARRLTFNSASEIPETFTPDGAEILFTAAIQDPAESILFPTDRLTEVYAVRPDGSGLHRVLPTPANNISFLPGGDSFLYEDVKGMEDKWRKHHTSSVTRDIWRYDIPSGSHTNLTSRPGEDRNAVASADGSRIYYLSEPAEGSLNVYSMNPDGSGSRAETSFTRHPVRFLSSAANGLLAFTYNGELYTMKAGATPARLAIDIVEDEPETERNIQITRATESLPSPDGKQVAYVGRGEIFVTSVEYPSVKQITHTPEAEYGLTWGKDGRELIYVSERSGRPAIYRARIARKDDPNFSNATLIEEELLTPDDGAERFYPRLSPDGKKLIYIKDRLYLTLMDMASGTETRLLDRPLSNYRSGEFDISWAPDSRWIAMEIMNPLHEPYSDIAILDTQTGELLPLTETGYFDQQPRWALDGNAVIFASERYGMRNHASWGSEYDIMIAFLNRDAYDRFRLSEEDYALLKEVEKQQKKDSAKKDAAKKDTGAKKDKEGKKKSDSDNGDKSGDEDAVKPVTIDRDGLRDRILRLTPNSSELSDFAISSDGETLYYLSSFEQGYDLWKKKLRKGDVSLVKKLDSRNTRISPDKDGNLFLLGPTVKKFDTKAETVKNVDIATRMRLDPRKEREYMFSYLCNEARERFYLPEMGIDWDGYCDDYRRFLPYISNNYDFADLMSELLGELNVSHSGGRYYGPGADEPTAALGLIYDLSHEGDGLRVSGIIPGGPFDRATTALTPGCIIESINGVALNSSSDWATALNNTLRRKTLVAFRDPSTGVLTEEVVLPVSQSAEKDLLYRRWVRRCEQAVDSLSGGRLGYVHLRSMSDDSYRTVYSKLLGEYAGKDGIVIDTRWNGGGRLHEDIEVLFSGEKYLTQEIHGRESSEMPSRRWNKPSIMIIGEANYSNAHGTPWVYSHKKMGKLVGMPVPGTMSSVNWIELQDPSLIFGVPVVAFRTDSGTYLENSQLEPDIRVANDPADAARGIDSQLAVAVSTLLRDLDARK